MLDDFAQIAILILCTIWISIHLSALHISISYYSLPKKKVMCIAWDNAVVNDLTVLRFNYDWLRIQTALCILTRKKWHCFVIMKISVFHRWNGLSISRFRYDSSRFGKALRVFTRKKKHWFGMLERSVPWWSLIASE